MPWANSAEENLIVFFLFFLANWIWNFTCLLRRQFTWNVKSYFEEKTRKLVTVFSEKTNTPTTKSFSFSNAGTLKKLDQGHQNLTSCLLCHKYISMKIWRIQPLVHKILCRQEKCYADANRICTKISMSLSRRLGDINISKCPLLKFLSSKQKSKYSVQSEYTGITVSWWVSDSDFLNGEQQAKEKLVPFSLKVCLAIFIPEFLKWTLPFLNLNLPTVANGGFRLKSKTEWQIV